MGKILNNIFLIGLMGFPGGSVVDSACQCRKHRRCLGSIPGLERFPQEEMTTTPVFLPEKSHGQRNLVGYSPWGCIELNTAKHIGLKIWKFSVHILLKPGLENFEHYFASVWDEWNFVVVWTFFDIALLWDWNENWPFPVLWPLLSFPNLLAYWVQHFHSIIFQDLK